MVVALEFLLPGGEGQDEGEPTSIDIQKTGIKPKPKIVRFSGLSSGHYAQSACNQ
jgi:hypothetical protein